jgi:putative transposase
VGTVGPHDQPAALIATGNGSFFAALKNEMYYRQSFATRARARFAVAEDIEVSYNRRWLHSTLGYRTPFQALTDYRTAATAAA